jgi:hypothetical protein
LQDLSWQTSACAHTSRFRLLLICPSLPTADNPAFFGIIYDVHGVVVGTTEIAQEISERKLAEAGRKRLQTPLQ